MAPMPLIVRFASTRLSRSFGLRLFGTALFLGALALAVPFTAFALTGSPQALRMAGLTALIFVAVGTALGGAMLVAEYLEFARPRRAAQRLMRQFYREHVERRREIRRAAIELERVLDRQRQRWADDACRGR